MSRILWLDGLEPDERQYATTATSISTARITRRQIGRRDSHGCIRMRNADVAELFELVEVGTPVVIAPPRRKVAGAEKSEKSVAQTKLLA